MRKKYAPERGFACEACGVAVGEPCVSIYGVPGLTVRGKPIRTYHNQRRIAVALAELEHKGKEVL